MDDNNSNKKTATPRHLWVVGILALLWNSMGAMDYVMTQTRNENYMNAFTAEQLDFFYGLPVWVVACWAIAIWGSVFASFLLLMRKAAAVWFFLLSLLAMLLTTFHNYVLSNGMEVIGDTFSLVFTALIFLIALGLFLYSKAMLNQKVLS